MAPQKTWHRIGLGRPGDGTVYFGEPSQIGYAIMNPNRNYYGFYLRSSMSFKRDNDSLPILKGQPSDERAVEICREWMKKLGIEEGKLARDDEDGTSGFDVWFFPQSVHTSRPDAEGNMKPLSFTFATHLIFRQRIGRYPAFFNGFGGTASFELADAGELSSVHWCLHVWEPMGEYEILDRDEITAAIKGGFCWTEGIIDTDAIRIDDIQLEAFHALPEVPQKTFPLIYRLVVHGLHEPRDAPHDIIFLPALKIHRHAYGKATPRGEGPPLPSPLPGQ